MSKLSTSNNKQLFISSLPKFETITETCKQIGIYYSTYWRWTQSDKIFKAKCQDLIRDIEQRKLDEYEAELDKRALGGVSKQSDILLMFALKALAPGKYREKPNLIPFVGDITVKLAVPPYRAVPETVGVIQHEAQTLKKGADYAIQEQREAEQLPEATNEAQEDDIEAK